MIRAGGALAVVASLGIFLGLLRHTHTAVLAGTVPPGEAPGEDHITFYLDSTSTVLPDGYASVPGLRFWQDTRQEKDALTIVTLVEAPAEAAQAAREGDSLVVRVRGVWWPSPVSWPVHTRYELRRSDGTVVVVNGPGNGRFLMVWVVAITAPLVLWGLAAVIVAVGPASPRRR